MSILNIFRADPTNAGDWHSAPFRHFDLGERFADILTVEPENISGRVVLGGGGLIAKTFHPRMAALAGARDRMQSLVAWGIGESEHVDKSGGLVPPYAGPLPDYMESFDLVGVRDFGPADGRVEWAPCASCMSPVFDKQYAVTREVAVYDHKRIPIPIDGFDRLSNNGDDIEEKVAFLGSAETVVTNSYHGAYWATLLGRKVVAIPNLSKMYRFKHAPVICEPAAWRRYASVARNYPEALSECRAATLRFHARVEELHGGHTAR